MCVCVCVCVRARACVYVSGVTTSSYIILSTLRSNKKKTMSDPYSLSHVFRISKDFATTRAGADTCMYFLLTHFTPHNSNIRVP